MKKNIFIYPVILCFAINLFAAPVLSEKKNDSHELHTETKASKLFGEKKKETGKDFSAQSTAGVEGGAKDGLSCDEETDPSINEEKDDLYNQPLEAMDKVIKTKKGK